MSRPGWGEMLIKGKVMDREDMAIQEIKEKWRLKASTESRAAVSEGPMGVAGKGLTEIADVGR